MGPGSYANEKQVLTQAWRRSQGNSFHGDLGALLSNVNQEGFQASHALANYVSFREMFPF